MAILYGWQRKLSFLPLSLVVVGWVVFSIGFIWELVDWPKDDGSPTYISRTSPLLFSQYFLLVGGPFVYLLGVAQAILPGIASSIVGVFTAFVSNVYLVLAGFHAYSGAKIVVDSENEGKALNTKEMLMFSGALFISICWCFVLMLSVSYKTKPKRNSYDIFDPPNGPQRSRKCAVPFTPGVARVLSIPFILLSLAGWCVFTMGVERLKVTRDSPDLIDFIIVLSPLATYGAITVGPLLYLAAFFHAGCSGGASTVMGVFTSILSTVYTVFIGFIVVTFGESIYSVCQLEFDAQNKPNCSLNHSSLPINLIYIFAGGVGSIFLWSFVLALRPFYRDHEQRSHADNVINSPQPQYGTMRMEESFNGSYSSQPLVAHAEGGKR